MTDIEALDQVEILLQKGWNKYTEALDAVGMPTHATSPTACSWCLAGAILKVYGYSRVPNFFGTPMASIFQALKDDFPGGFHGYGLTGFNDAPNITHQDVIALLQKTKARLKAAAAAV